MQPDILYVLYSITLLLFHYLQRSLIFLSSYLVMVYTCSLSFTYLVVPCIQNRMCQSETETSLQLYVIYIVCIARACEGYITFEDTKRGSYMQYIGPISILYTIYCMMVTVYIQYIDSPHQRDDVTIILYIYIYIYIYT